MFLIGQMSPIHVACTNHNLAIKLHIDLNCNFSLKNFEGMLPLHIACSKSLECVKIMSKSINNDDVMVSDENGDTPLHLALRHNHSNVRYLTSNFICDVTIPNKSRELPSHLACATTLIAVKMVLKCNADVSINHQTTQGDTPLHIACRAGALDIVQYLSEFYDCKSS